MRCVMLRGTHEGLAASIDHGRAGRVLTDVAAHSPSAQADYDSALAVFRGLVFPLLDSLISHKDSSIENIMTLLRFDDQLAGKPGTADLQPDMGQLSIPVHGAGTV